MIDSHHHFWHYTPEQYGWIDQPMSAIRRDFLPEHLASQIKAAHVEKVISVQARQTLGETDWLLELSRQHDFIAAVVGWVPLIDPDVERALEPRVFNPKFRSVRHVLQGEADDYLARDDFNRGIAALGRFHLAYDILITHRQLPAAIQLVDRHPDQPFILDHLAKPPAKSGQIEPWRTHLRELARRPWVWCKLSGLVTEADYHSWTAERLTPYLDAALEAFGARRLMFGSDWPVCLVACGYGQWLELLQQWAAPLSENERQWIFRRAAATAYGLNVSLPTFL